MTAAQVNCPDGNSQPTAFLSISHPYLFWSTGVYLLLELVKQYRVVLITEGTLCDDAAITAFAASLPAVIHLQLPPARSHIIRHIRYSRVLRQAANRYRPALVLQHHHMFAHNLYAFHWAKHVNPTCITGVYLNAQLRKTDPTVLLEQSANESLARMPESIRPAFATLFLTPRWFAKVLLYFVLPCLVTGLRLPLRTSLRQLSLHRLPREHEYPSLSLVELYLTYYSTERDTCRVFGDRLRLHLVKHPVETVAGSDHQLVTLARNYATVTEKSVLVLPSLLGFDRTQHEDRLLAEWCLILEALKKQFAGYRIIFKLHPRTYGRARASEVVAHLQARFPTLTILEARESAEALTIGSNVVVSDVSTTLWWANFFDGKLAISFDVGGNVGSDDMRSYEGILYFAGVDEFLAHTPDSLTKLQTSQRRQRQTLPPLMSVLARTEN